MSQPVVTKKLSRRAFLGAAASFAGISALSACVPPTTGSAPAAPAAPAAPGATAAPQAAAPAGQQTISFWSMYEPTDDENPRAYTQAFLTANPGYKVDLLEKIGYANIGTKLTAAVAGGDAPDVASFWAAPSVGQFAPNDLIIPLDDYLTKDNFDWGKYTPAGKDMVTVDNKIWAIPTSHNTYALFWNKTLFQEVGLDPEKGPATVDELNAFAAKIWKFNADGTVARSGFIPWQPEDWNSFNWFAVWGAKLYDPATRKVLLNDENAVACYDWYYSHIQKYGKKAVLDWVASSAPGYGGRSIPEGPLYTDRIGMWHGGQWYVGLARRYGGEKLKFGVVPLPQSPKGKPKPSRFEADVLIIPKGSKNPDGGWKFIKWVTDPDTDTPLFKWLLSMAYLPSSLKYLQNGAQLEPKLAADKEWAVFADLAANGDLHPDPKIPVFQKLADEINAGRDAILNEAKTPSQGLNDAQAAVQKALDEYLATKS